MSAAMAQDRRPGDTDMHRRQRGKNLFIAGFLLVLVILFFGLTIVRMGGFG
jgi:Tfp pilus assembly protein PilX